jgi:hypothetical protein
MIGDMLLLDKRPGPAFAEYEITLKANPGRFNALYGAATASAALGRNDRAHEYYAEIVKNCADSKSDRAELKHAREEAERLARASAVLMPKLFPNYRPSTAIVNLAEINRAAST